MQCRLVGAAIDIRLQAASVLAEPHLHGRRVIAAQLEAGRRQQRQDQRHVLLGKPGARPGASAHVPHSVTRGVTSRALADTRRPGRSCCGWHSAYFVTPPRRHASQARVMTCSVLGLGSGLGLGAQGRAARAGAPAGQTARRRPAGRPGTAAPPRRPGCRRPASRPRRPPPPAGRPARPQSARRRPRRARGRPHRRPPPRRPSRSAPSRAGPPRPPGARRPRAAHNM